jgi:hypothetical protein
MIVYKTLFRASREVWWFFNINCTYISIPRYPTDFIWGWSFSGRLSKEETRKFVFISLASFIALYENDIVVNRIDDYLNIPQNKVNFMILSIKGQD